MKSGQDRPTTARESSTRSLIQVGAALLVGGIALAVGGDEAISRWLALTGAVLLVLGLHRFGRLGTDSAPS